MLDLSKLRDAILSGDAPAAVATAGEALEAGVTPIELITKTMIPAMDEAGRLFEAEEYFIPELLLAARAMKAVLQILRPLLAATGAQPAGRVVIGTVKGDLHDIGKNLVASMLEGAGFEVIDLGVDVPPEKFVAAVMSENVDLVAMSALLSMTLPGMKATVDALNFAGLRRRAKIIIGGAPATQQFADEIGADGYGANANSAVTLARSLLGK